MSEDRIDFIEKMTQETFELIEGGGDRGEGSQFEELLSANSHRSFDFFYTGSFYVLKWEERQIEFPQNWSFFENLTRAIEEQVEFSFYRVSKESNIDGLFDLIFHELGEESFIVKNQDKISLISFKQADEECSEFYLSLKKIAATMLENNKEEQVIPVAA